MKATLVRIGNSRGIRLPKPVIEQCGFQDEVEMEVHHHELVIRSSSHPRDGWAGAFARMSECGDDELLDRVAETGPTWDEEEVRRLPNNGMTGRKPSPFCRTRNSNGGRMA